MRGLLDRLRPHSFQARVAVAISIALVVVFVVIQLVFVSIVQERQRAGVEATLRQQADSIARAVQRGGLSNAAATSRDAGRFIGDARLVVSVDGEVVHWNEPVSHLEASATGTPRRGPGADAALRPGRRSALGLGLHRPGRSWPWRRRAPSSGCWPRAWGAACATP